MDKSKVAEARQYRIYPTNEQMDKINDNIEFNREMWNYMLAFTYSEQIKKLKDKYGNSYKVKYLYNYLKSLDYKEQKQISKILNQVTPKKIYSEFTRLKFGDTSLYNYTKKALRQAFKSHFKSPQHFGMPKFKSYLDTLYQGSYSTKAGKACYFKSDSIFKISKVGDVRIVNHYKSNGRLFKVTVIRKPDNKYYVSLFFEQDNHTKIFKKTGKYVGIDFGVKATHAVVTSDWAYFKRPDVKRLRQKLDWETHKLGKEREKLKPIIAQWNHEHKDNPKSLQDFSNYQKNRLKVARIDQRIRKIYDYWIKTTASKIVAKYDVIAIEDLSVSKMMKNKRYARYVAESHFRELRATIEYKAAWSGKKVIAVDPVNTTQTCSTCGYELKDNEKIGLDTNEWICPKCKAKHLRKYNAARNILKKALA